MFTDSILKIEAQIKIRGLNKSIRAPRRLREDDRLVRRALKSLRDEEDDCISGFEFCGEDGPIELKF